MRGRTPIGVLGLSLLLAATAHADTRVAADLNIHLGSRPAPVVVFEREPDVVLVESYGFNSGELRRILRVVHENRAALLRAWHDHFGDDGSL